MREMGKWIYDKTSDWVSERQDEKFNVTDEFDNE